ncbi:MAG: hypothetical protein KJ939_07515 [Nanoarchaeota archaeon]|nr:hypothetical protein [Nanoarchaeota archaeon]
MCKITLRFVRGLSEKFKLALDWLKKASPYIVGVCLLISVFLLLVGASRMVVQAATRSGYSVVGWVAVIVFWFILIVAGMRQGSASSSGSDEKGMSDEQNRNST